MTEAFVLTPRQRQTLDYIEEHLARDRYAPSVREIRHAIGVKSNSCVVAALEALQAKGFIRRVPGRVRNIQLLHGSVSTLGPLVRAAEALLGSIKEEHPEQDIVGISATTLGDLDIALAELRDARGNTGPPPKPAGKD